MRQNQRIPARGSMLALALLAPAALVGLGGCQTDGRSAIRYDDAALAMDDDRAAPASPNATTLYSLGRILARQGKSAEAEIVLRNAIQRYPDFLPAYAELAELHVRAQRLDAAAATLEQALQVDARSPVILNNLGMCRLLQKRYPEAHDAFARAVAAQPRDPKYISNLALVSGMLGSYEDALELYTTIVGPARAHHNLGVICEAIGDLTGAEANFAIAARLGRQYDRPRPPATEPAAIAPATTPTESARLAQSSGVAPEIVLSPTAGRAPPATAAESAPTGAQQPAAPPATPPAAAPPPESAEPGAAPTIALLVPAPEAPPIIEEDPPPSVVEPAAPIGAGATPPVPLMSAQAPGSGSAVESTAAADPIGCFGDAFLRRLGAQPLRSAAAPVAAGPAPPRAAPDAAVPPSLVLAGSLLALSRGGQPPAPDRSPRLRE